MEEAVAFYARNIYSFSGDNHTFIGLHLDRLKTVPSKLEMVNNFMDVIWKRIRDVQFTCRDYRGIMKSADKNGVLMYFDPPYYKAGHHYVKKSDGSIKWEENHYIQLNNLLKEITKAKFVLSIDKPDIFYCKDWYIDPVTQASFTPRTEVKMKKEFIIRNFDKDKERTQSKSKDLFSFTS